MPVIDESQRTCGGQCCESFYIGSHSPIEIGARYLDAVARIAAGEATAHDWENAQVAEMIFRIDEDDEAAPRYSCENLRPDGLCGIYATRPKMCREYPGYGHGHRCNACGFQQPLPPCRRLTAGIDGA